MKPPPLEGDAEPPAGTPPDTRPGPGDDVAFTEELTAGAADAGAAAEDSGTARLRRRLRPGAGAAARAVRSGRDRARAGGDVRRQPVRPCRAAGAAAPVAAPAGVPLRRPRRRQRRPSVARRRTGRRACCRTGAPAAAAPSTLAMRRLRHRAPPRRRSSAPAPTTVVRVYALRGIAKSGRPGQPSARLTVPIVNPPLAAERRRRRRSPTSALTLEWTPPAAGGRPDDAPPSFNVYRIAPTPDAAGAAPARTAGRPGAGDGKPDAPVNPAPLAAAKLELPGVTLGTEQCFAVRAVHVVQNVAIESDAEPDDLRHAEGRVPAGDAAERSGCCSLDGAIELVWDAGTEADIAGYTVLRGEAPGDTLRPLTPSPIRESTLPRSHREAGRALRLRGGRGRQGGQRQPALDARRRNVAR